MVIDISIKARAIALRKNGLTYSEILREIPVAKSTLSLWLHDMGLSKTQEQRLTRKKMLAVKRGGAARRKQRIENANKIKLQARSEIGRVTTKDLWLAGIMLYWAEGAKEKPQDVSVGIKFSNSDPQMIVIFIKWLTKCLRVQERDIVFEIYIHKSREKDKEKIINFWSEITNYPRTKFDKIYLKRHNRSPRRKNIDSGYHGQFVVRVKRSTDINRKISGWIEGFCQQCGIV